MIFNDQNRLIAGLSGCASAAVLLIAMAPGVAMAQAAAPATTAEPEVIVVTGSRIRSTQQRAISPVQVITATQLRENGNIDVDQVLREQPAFAPTIGQTTSPALQESHGASTVDMRGLGQNRSLVLVNGQRATPNGFRNSVDINTIPSTLIERVEYLTGGAAAVYGADAVAGVTNFILRDSYEGIELTTSGSISGQGDAESYNVGLTAGRNFFDDRLNLTAHVAYSERGILRREDRDWAAVEVDDTGNPRLNVAPIGGQFTRNCFTGTVCTQFNLSGFGGPAASTSFTLRDNGQVGTLLNSNISRFAAFINPSERVNISLFGKFTVSEALEFYARYQDADVFTQSQNVPVSTATNTLSQRIRVRRDNPFLTPQLLGLFNPVFNANLAGTAAGTDSVLININRSLTELGPRIDETDRTMNQLVLGFRGEVYPGVRYDFSHIQGENIETVTRANAGVAARVAQSGNVTVVGGVAQCVDTSNGCVPGNFFGPNSLSPQAAAWIAGDPFNFNTRVRTQDVTSMVLSGDTIGFNAPGGPIGWAVGIEHREEEATTDFGDPAKFALTMHAGGVRLFQRAAYSLNEVYAEVKVPLLADLPFIQSLEIEGAYRFTEHSQAGEYDTSKIGFNWQVNDTLRLRGSQQTVVRGANLGELFNLIDFPALANTILDPCANAAEEAATLAFCQADGAPAPGYAAGLVGANGANGGNPNMKPESGETFTYGFILNPQFMRGASLIVDYYNIALEDAISTVSVQDKLNFCYRLFRDNANPLCADITRDPVTGLVRQVITADTNIAGFEVSGWDVTFAWSARMPRDLPGDRFNISYTANIVTEFKRQLFPGAAISDCAGFFSSQASACSESGLSNRAVPEYRHNFNVSWTDGPLTLRGTWRNLGQTDNLVPNPPAVVQHLDIYDLFDAGISYRFSDKIRASVTVSNLFDTEPPLMGTNQAYANTYPNQYDIIGRRYTANVTWRF